jgi:hypothetical protein
MRDRVMWGKAWRWFVEGLTAENDSSYDGWRFAIPLILIAVVVYGGVQALSPGLTPSQRFFRFGVPVILVVIALRIPMPPKRT